MTSAHIARGAAGGALVSPLMQQYSPCSDLRDTAHEAQALRAGTTRMYVLFASSIYARPHKHVLLRKNTANSIIIGQAVFGSLAMHEI